MLIHQDSKNILSKLYIYFISRVFNKKQKVLVDKYLWIESIIRKKGIYPLLHIQILLPIVVLVD